MHDAEPAEGPPVPVGAQSYDELVDRLRGLRTWAGVSYRELHRRVLRARRERGIAELPAYDTVYRCLQPGRQRLDVELVTEIVSVLAGRDAANEWRQACRAIAVGADESSVVGVSDRLPDDLDGFTGRTAELCRLMRLSPETLATRVITGMAGVGKTALAVHAAHLLIQQGRVRRTLSVDLRGFGVARSPADPAAVLDGFLRRLGVPGSRIAELNLDRRAALFRELLAEQPTVLLLDNAESDAQVRPLLPDSPACITLITSRSRISGADIEALTLDVFDRAESVELLRRTAGAELIDADVPSAGSIAALVGDLPLGLAMVAGRITNTPSWSLADHLEQLSEKCDRLKLDSGVERAMASSYYTLPEGHRLMLRLLAIQPGMDWDARTAAALSGIELEQAERMVAALTGASMLRHRAPGRFTLHELVRVFCADRAGDECSPSERREAIARLLDYHAAAAAAAIDVYARHDKQRRPQCPAGQHALPELADQDAATAWLEAERPNLIAAAAYAAEHGWPAHTGRMSMLLGRYLDDTARFRDAEVLHLLAAGQSADPAGRAHAFDRLGGVYWRLGRPAEAVDHIEQALAQYRQIGDRAGEGRALGHLGIQHMHLGDYRAALGAYHRSRDIALEVGDRYGLAHARHNLGVAYEGLGRYREALEEYRSARELYAEIGDEHGIARAMNNVGCVLARIGQHAEAMAQFRHNLEVSTAIADQVTEGRVLGNIGELLQRQGMFDEAKDHYQRSVTIARAIGHRDGEGDALRRLGAVHEQLGDVDAALRYLQEALEIARTITARQREIEACNGLGSATLSAGRPDDARKLYQSALTMAENLGYRFAQAVACAGLAAACKANGDTAAAREHGRRALALHTDLGTPEAADIDGAQLSRTFARA